MSSTAEIDEGFEKATGAPKAAGDDLSKLPDGEYVFEIKEGAMRTPQGKPLVELKLEVVEGGGQDGAVVKSTHWLTKKGDGPGAPPVVNEIELNIVKGYLKALGFDADEWTKANGRPFSAEFEKAAKLLPGLRFKGKKVSKDGNDGKKFNSLYVKERATFNGEAADGKPLTFSAESLAKAAADPFNLDD